MEAERHPLEAERLRALYSYEILDTDREKDFDDIVQLAAAICGTAISVVNLIDADRQWFKAETGLGVRETPLATSICSHAILETKFVEIRDTLRDSRMMDNPLCYGEPGLRFYAGALLTTEEGLPLGTLCVLDYEPKELTSLQRDALRVLARQVMVQLEMRKALDVAKVLRQEVDHRVKNSLHSLASFVRIQGRSLNSEEAKSVVADVQNRMEAVAALHEQLYRTDAGATVDLGRYVRNVCEHLAGLAPQSVALEIKADAVTVSAQHAVAVGTLVNECVANSFKHAFPDQRAGKVRVVIESRAGGMIGVTCSDNGTGMEAAGDQPFGGLGTKIVEIVCMELQCELKVDSSPRGVTTDLQFQSGVGETELTAFP